MSVRDGKPEKRIFLSPPWMSGDERSRVDEAFASNYIAPCGPMVDRFERACEAATGLPHACAVSSGTAALDLLYHELGVTRGDAVFCSDLTFVSSIAPAVHRGAEPVFIDCDEATWTLDPGLLAEALAAASQAGRLPKAVVAVDLYGQCCDYDRIEAVCGAYGVPLIVDAAEALGARYDGGRRTEGGGWRTEDGGRRSALVREGVSALVGEGGRRTEGGGRRAEDGGRRTEDGGRRAEDGGRGSTLVREGVSALVGEGGRRAEDSAERPRGRSAGDAGWAAVYSFNGNKIITTSGGGLVASRDAGVIERARKRAQQARESKVWYEHEELGYNYRMSNIVAAIGVGQLQHLDEIVAKKRQIFEWYSERLQGVDGIRFMPEAGYGRCTRWLTVMEMRSEELGRRAEDGGRGSSLVRECVSALVGEEGRRTEDGGPAERVMKVIEALEKENIESRPVWKPMHLQPVFRGARTYGGRVSERLFENGLCLPSGTGLALEEIDRICGVVAAALRDGA